MTRRQLWPVMGSLTAAVFAVEAVAQASGTVFAITAIVTGTTYAIVASLTRGDARGRWGDLFHRSAVYVKATTVADVHEVLGVQRAGSGPPRWARPAGEATARRVLSRRRPNWLLQRVPVLE